MKVDIYLVLFLILLILLFINLNSWGHWLSTAPCDEILKSSINMRDIPARCFLK